MDRQTPIYYTELLLQGFQGALQGLSIGTYLTLEKLKVFAHVAGVAISNAPSIQQPYILPLIVLSLPSLLSLCNTI